MTHLLSRENSEVLAQLAWARTLLAFDFDGTLAPIVADPKKAVMRASTAKLLAQVCERYPCAVLSGRSKADVRSRLVSARVKYIMGNHGLEPGSRLNEFEQQMAQVKPLLSIELAEVQGIDLEDKRYSLALHYRKSRNKGLARRAIRAAVANLPFALRTVAGKLVVNLVPEGAPNKGDALVDLRANAAADTALYIGDDVTDEDVFRLDQPGRLVSVRVGESKHSAATYFLRNQREIDRLLERMLGLRKAAVPR